MKRLLFIIFTIFVAFSSLLTSCRNDNDIDFRFGELSFSCDTLSFDTIFTDIPTRTARFIVSNRSGRDLTISRIGLKRSNSVFSINVDGENGSVFSNVEIAARDSIYIFVECFVPGNGEKSLIEEEDDLEFDLGGKTQSVKLIAKGENAVKLRGVVIRHDTSFQADKPYLIYDSLIVERGATLKLEAGVRLMFHDKARMVVRGTLHALGEAGNRIEMRGDRRDEIFPGVGYEILSGQWEGIRIEKESYDNRLEYVEMQSTESGLQIDSCGNSERMKLKISNSWLHNSVTDVMSASHCRIEAKGVCFSEAGEAVVRLTGGQYDFEYCTLANNYLFSGIQDAALTLHSEKEMKLEMKRTIIWSLGADMNLGDLNDTEIYLREVALKSKGSNDSHFLDCRWEIEPMFLTVREKYYFNYHLKSESPAAGLGAWGASDVGL